MLVVVTLFVAIASRWLLVVVVADLGRGSLFVCCLLLCGLLLLVFGVVRCSLCDVACCCVQQSLLLCGMSCLLCVADVVDGGFCRVLFVVCCVFTFVVCRFRLLLYVVRC